METANQEKIIEFYDSCKGDYRFLWNLDKNHAIHYGYWDEKVHNFNQSLLRFNEIILERAKITNKDKVLDAGCGVGGTSTFIAEKTGCKMEGITICSNQVSDAKKLAEEKKLNHLVRFSLQDYMNTEFPDKSFDVIFGLESICYANKGRFLEEAYRLLKKGGRLVVADGFASKINFEAEEKAIMNKWLSGWAVDDLETPDFFKEKSKELGFRNIGYKKVTDNVMRSARRLYMASFPAFIITYTCNMLGLRSEVQTNNVIAAHNQYKGLKKELWEYGVFYAEK